MTEAVDPGITQTKHRIRKVGTITVGADGTSIDVDHWHFLHNIGDWLPSDTTWREQEIDGRIAGWAPWELHDIAHGWPCGCGVEKALRDAGLDFPYQRGPL